MYFHTVIQLNVGSVALHVKRVYTIWYSAEIQ